MTGAGIAVTTVIAAAVSACTTHWMVSFAPKLGAIDIANSRSSHVGAVPRSGGSGLFASMVFVAVVGASQFRPTASAWLVMAAVALIALVGFVDDLRGLPALPRLALQCAFGLSMGWLFADRGGAAGWWLLGLVAACAWSVFAINTVNFMDGINGITSTTALLGVAGVLAVDWVEGVPGWLRLGALGFGAAVIGFLPYNLPVARIFLGDIGSYLVGAVFAVVGLLALDSHLAAMVFVAAFGVYTFDVLYTLQSRIRRRVNVFEPHREHLYQRIATGGWSHVRVDGLIAVLVLVPMIVGLLMARLEMSMLSQWLTFSAVEIAVLGAYLIIARGVGNNG